MTVSLAVVGCLLFLVVVVLLILLLRRRSERTSKDRTTGFCFLLFCYKENVFLSTDFWGVTQSLYPHRPSWAINLTTVGIESLTFHKHQGGTRIIREFTICDKAARRRSFKTSKFIQTGLWSQRNSQRRCRSQHDIKLRNIASLEQRGSQL